MKIELTKTEFDGLSQRQALCAQKHGEFEVCKESVQYFLGLILKKHGESLDQSWKLEGSSLVKIETQENVIPLKEEKAS
jgi:hypothetical protein